MASPKVQSGYANIGNSGSGTFAFSGAQTAGNCNVICLWILGSTSSADVTSVTQAGNTYTLRAYAPDPSGGFGAAVAIYTATGIAAAGAGSNVTITWGAGKFVDVIGAEYPAVTGFRTSHADSQYGGAASAPRASLTGTTSLDLAVAAAWCANFTVSTAGSIGANAANLVEANPDGWAAEDGLSDGSSPLAVSFGGGTGDWWTAVAVAFQPAGGGGGAASPIESASRRQLQLNSIYRM